VIGDQSQSIVTEKSDTFAPGTFPGTLDQAVAIASSVNILDVTKQG